MPTVTRRHLVRLSILLTALPLWASDDAGAILKRWIEEQPRNDQRAEQYTYVEETQWFAYDKKSQPHKVRSATSEVIFIEGLNYKRLVARNGKPLDRREQAQVENEMRQTAEERRKHRGYHAPGGRINFANQSMDVGSREELLTLFDNRLVGEEEIRGRKAWVIESTPKAGLVAANEHEKEVLCFRKKHWIDETDNVLTRQMVTITGDGYLAKPGSTLTFEFDKIGQDTWHEVLIVLDLYSLRDKAVKPSGRTEYRLSKFQKFDVQSTITVDPPQ
jgi:hypothetical protein